jgi:hypothetical protein
MNDRQPDFIVIGAMKSATTTLHEQLARQPGIFMSRPKEPNFFSDDDIYARGLPWYLSLFQGAGEAALCGESSTHYTKLPAYPRSVERMARTLPRVKLIYVMRHPIDRLVSHYVHERSLESVPAGIEGAVDKLPRLVDYGLYSMQLRPFLETFCPQNVLPVFFGRLVRRPQEELERICTFIGYLGQARWDTALRPQNVGRERLRKSALREMLVQAPQLTAIRRRLAPRILTEQIKAHWRIKGERIDLWPELRNRLCAHFDPDLERLGSWLGVSLSCENFSEMTEARPYEWSGLHGCE